VGNGLQRPVDGPASSELKRKGGKIRKKKRKKVELVHPISLGNKTRTLHGALAIPGIKGGVKKGHKYKNRQNLLGSWPPMADTTPLWPRLFGSRSEIGGGDGGSVILEGSGKGERGDQPVLPGPGQNEKVQSASRLGGSMRNKGEVSQSCQKQKALGG